MSDIGSPVKDFLGGLFKEVDAGLKEAGFKTCPQKDAHADIELHTIATDEGGGKAGIKILNFIEGSKEKSMTNSDSHKITIHVKKHVPITIV